MSCPARSGRRSPTAEFGLEVSRIALGQALTPQPGRQLLLPLAHDTSTKTEPDGMVVNPSTPVTRQADSGMLLVAPLICTL